MKLLLSKLDLKQLFINNRRYLDNNSLSHFTRKVAKENYKNINIVNKILNKRQFKVKYYCVAIIFLIARSLDTKNTRFKNNKT